MALCQKYLILSQNFVLGAENTNPFCLTSLTEYGVIISIFLSSCIPVCRLCLHRHQSIIFLSSFDREHLECSLICLFWPGVGRVSKWADQCERVLDLAAESKRQSRIIATFSRKLWLGHLKTKEVLQISAI